MGFLSWVVEQVTGTPEAIRQFDSPENRRQRQQEFLDSEYMRRDAAYQELGRRAALVVHEDKPRVTAITTRQSNKRQIAERGSASTHTHERAVEYGAAKIDPAKLSGADLKWFAAMPTRTVERHSSRDETHERQSSEQADWWAE